MNFYANGKLLLTGEYFVMKGARALALPVRYGQSLEVSTNSEPGILQWKAYEEGRCWFEATIAIPDIVVKETNSTAKADFLISVLKKSKQLNTEFFNDYRGYKIKTNLNFPGNWGLGSSSTLIHLISQWANVNPFKLHSLVSKGSGYDIACASKGNPIVYQRINNTAPEIEDVQLSESITKHIYFVYSGKKMPTEQHIGYVLDRMESKDIRIEQINNLTNEVIRASDPVQLEKIIDEHENVISGLLKTAPIKECYFNDFKGAIKSLGAWGGDFFMALSSEPESYVKQYFEHFSLSEIIPYDKMIPA